MTQKYFRRGRSDELPRESMLAGSVGVSDLSVVSYTTQRQPGEKTTKCICHGTKLDESENTIQRHTLPSYWSVCVCACVCVVLFICLFVCLSVGVRENLLRFDDEINRKNST